MRTGRRGSRTQPEHGKQKPASVGTYVTSATHSRFGPAASKRRPTRSGAGRTRTARRVVRGPRRRLTPAMPAERITRATRLRLTAAPASDSSA